MSLWDRLYEAQHAHPRALPQRVPPRRGLDGRWLPTRVALSAPTVRAIERVLDREITTFRATRAAALAQDRLVHLASARPPRRAPTTRALPYQHPRAALAPGRALAPCAICGGPVRIDRLDVDGGSARLECLDCGRHWTEEAPRPMPAAPLDPNVETRPSR